MNRRRIHKPWKLMRPGLYEVTVYLMGGREYLWKGRAGNDEIAEKRAMKRLTKLPVALALTRVRN